MPAPHRQQALGVGEAPPQRLPHRRGRGTVPNVEGLEAKNAFTDDAMGAVQKGYVACVEEIREKVPFRCADE